MKILLRSQLYALQLFEYDPKRFLKWILNNPFKPDLEKKGRLVLTTKAKFLTYSSGVVFVLLAIFNFQIFPNNPTGHLLGTVALATTYIFFPWFYLLVSLSILRIYEIPNRYLTINRARSILSGKKNLLVIGVTGSYGKTTVKQMLTLLLSAKYKVLATPKSFNTLFGISNIIKNDLREDHEIFIVEMGAYKRGEISELCKMVKPKIGIITGITDQHFERFGSESNIVKAKYELIESLPTDGLAVFNLYSKPCCELYERTKNPKIGYSRIDNPNGLSSDLIAEIIDSSPTKSTFDLRIESPLLGNKQIIRNFTLSLPAEHNVSNALAAISVALFLGVDYESILNSLKEIRAPEHRLQILHQPDGTVIIDDAYSSNAEGAKAAVSLTKKFKNQPKIIVTPGIVELGSKQSEENKIFGKLIAENFDYAVIVNKTNRKALLSGLVANGWFFLAHTLVEHLGFSEKQLENYDIPKGIKEKVYIVDNLEEVTKEILPKLVKPGSLILFENDLPDIYN